MRRSYAHSAGQSALMDLGHPELPVFDPARCASRPISHLTAARMVETYHYAHRVPPIVAAIGMYVDDVLAGCITYGIPAVPNVQRACGEEYRKRTLELNRLYLHDWAGRNSESWLIGASFRWLADRWPEYGVLVSYADESAGHVGTIYQATNWTYTGRNEDGGGEILLNGRLFHPRALGSAYGTEGVKGACRQRRSVKHRYVYFLGDRRQRRTLRAALRWPVLPYPKQEATT